MYTGIIEATGTVRDVDHHDGGLRLSIDAPFEREHGDSLAVDGVCLTVAAREDGLLVADCSAETRRRTTIGRLDAGDTVNLERPLAADGRFDGHVVKGTVDTTTTLREVRDGGDTHEYVFERPASPYVVEKGAIALDGASLTVADVGSDTFTVATVPTTRDETALPAVSVGDAVNVEYDVLAKYARGEAVEA
ncbi:riboflavin synthase [Natronomonas halophila]|uniref:riboflavin synthase n=1 Tax=Natronomonas halophila TaxID=2747817 RepID=UPI0015B3D774|nr:riboflavin synthase [Natronomonas halophila]QLD85912.1 riboflavin synthase [Natronomonas halophila]